MLKLTQEELATALATLPGWKLENGSLTRSLTFKTFPDAIAFVNRLAVAAEAAGHHPDIDIRYNILKISLTTHDAGGITTADTKMALQINGIAG